MEILRKVKRIESLFNRENKLEFEPVSIGSEREKAVTLSKLYSHTIIQLDKREKIKAVKASLNNMDLHGLIIIVGQKMQPLSYVFKDRNYGLNKAIERNSLKSIVAGHKLYNASKKFKMRQATGRERIQRFYIENKI